MCSAACLRLHKFASNSKAVLDALPAEDRAKDLKDLDLCLDVLPVQCSLGTYWCIKTDTIGFRIELKDKLLTRRGNSFNRELSVRPTRHSSSSYLSGKTTTSRTMPWRHWMGWSHTQPQSLTVGKMEIGTPPPWENYDCKVCQAPQFWWASYNWAT